MTIARHSPLAMVFFLNINMRYLLNILKIICKFVVLLIVYFAIIQIAINTVKLIKW